MSALDQKQKFGIPVEHASVNRLTRIRWPGIRQLPHRFQYLSPHPLAIHVTGFKQLVGAHGRVRVFKNTA